MQQQQTVWLASQHLLHYLRMLTRHVCMLWLRVEARLTGRSSYLPGELALIPARHLSCLPIFACGQA